MKLELVNKVKDVLNEISLEEKVKNKEVREQVEFLKKYLGNWDAGTPRKNKKLKVPYQFIARGV